MTRLIVSFLVVGLGDALQILFDSTNHFHRDLTRRTHPEQPARVTACLRALDRLPVELIDIADVPNAIDGLTVDRYQPFDKQQLDHARDMMRATHRPDLVDALEDYCTLVKQERVQDGLPPLAHLDYIDRDTYLTTETFSVCHRAAAAWIHAVDQCRSSKVAMALTRPPGHHATEDTQNGFCFFNFAAIAAVHALQDPTVSKVSILDFDVHYGQGIAEQVEKYERARFCSIHQVPAFPYMGETRGRQGVYENVLNLPIQADTTWGKSWLIANAPSLCSFSRTLTKGSGRFQTLAFLKPFKKPWSFFAVMNGTLMWLLSPRALTPWRVMSWPVSGCRRPTIVKWPWLSGST